MDFGQYIPRAMTSKIESLSKKFPLFALLGPRQSGKTTLIRKLYPEHPYVSLEDPDRRRFATEDPRGFLATYCKHNRIFLDEVQRVPDLFSYIQTQVDEQPLPASFVLSGSHNFLLNQHLSQTLAGRIAILTLLPLTYQELYQSAKEKRISLNSILFDGMYPRVHSHEIDPIDWYPNYIRTFIEKDVRLVQNIGDLNAFHLFLKLCAGRTGQLLNLTALGNECGISHNTARAWLSILEGSYIVFLLQPYHKNFNKRLIKSPKLYFYDIGVACSLLGLESAEQLATHYAKGALFESFVISEIIKDRFNAGLSLNCFFWRDNHGHEIDCIYEKADQLIPIEIKSSQTPNSSFFDALLDWNHISETSSVNNRIIYGGEEDQIRQKGRLLSWRNISLDKF